MGCPLWVVSLLGCGPRVYKKTSWVTQKDQAVSNIPLWLFIRSCLQASALSPWSDFSGCWTTCCKMKLTHSSPNCFWSWCFYQSSRNPSTEQLLHTTISFIFLLILLLSMCVHTCHGMCVMVHNIEDRGQLKGVCYFSTMWVPEIRPQVSG